MKQKVKFMLSLIILLLGLVLITACSSSDGSTSTASSSSESEESQNVVDYPNKVINVLVGYSPGGGSDTSARKMVESLNKSGIIEQSFVVENMPGSGGALAMRELGTNRKADEYTISFEAAYGPSLWNGGVGSLTLSDYRPIAQLATDYVVLVARADAPYDTIEEFVEAWQNDPQSVAISLGAQLTGDDAWLWNNIKKGSGVDGNMRAIAHDGTNPALLTLLSGDADVAVLTPNLINDHLEEGTLKALAVSTEERVDLFKDTPTLMEAGIDVSYYRPRGVWMGGEVSEEVVTFWENALKEMAETEGWKEYVETSFMLPIYKDSEEFREYIESEGTSYQAYFESMK